MLTPVSVAAGFRQWSASQRERDTQSGVRIVQGVAEELSQLAQSVADGLHVES
jgi:hypothetical protein